MLLLKETAISFKVKLLLLILLKPKEAEDWLRAKLGRKRLDISWDHSDKLIHKFTVTGIDRSK